MLHTNYIIALGNPQLVEPLYRAIEGKRTFLFDRIYPIPDFLLHFGWDDTPPQILNDDDYRDLMGFLPTDTDDLLRIIVSEEYKDDETICRYMPQSIYTQCINTWGCYCAKDFTDTYWGTTRSAHTNVHLYDMGARNALICEITTVDGHMSNLISHYGKNHSQEDFIIIHGHKEINIDNGDIEIHSPMLSDCEAFTLFHGYFSTFTEPITREYTNNAYNYFVDSDLNHTMLTHYRRTQSYPGMPIHHAHP